MGKNEANVCLIAHNVFNIPEPIINHFFRLQFNDVYNENKKILYVCQLYTLNGAPDERAEGENNPHAEVN